MWPCPFCHHLLILTMEQPVVNALWDKSQRPQVAWDCFLEIQSKTLHVLCSPSLIFAQTPKSWKKMLTTSWRTRNNFQLCWKEYSQKTMKFFSILGNEIKETQESVQKKIEKVGGQIKLLQTELIEVKRVIASLSLSNVHFTQNMIFMQQIRDYVNHLATIYTRIKPHRASFYA